MRLNFRSITLDYSVSYTLAHWWNLKGPLMLLLGLLILHMFSLLSAFPVLFVHRESCLSSWRSLICNGFWNRSISTILVTGLQWRSLLGFLLKALAVLASCKISVFRFAALLNGSLWLVFFLDSRFWKLVCQVSDVVVSILLLIISHFLFPL